MENELPVKSIPSNLEAERAVLGSLLIDPDAIIKVATFLRVEDFYRERHGWLYDVMLTLHERREPLDFVTVVDELERRQQLEEIGGPAYITDLIGGTPTSINVDFYARIVERTALLRRLISAAGEIAALAYDESREVEDVIDRAETLVFGVSEARIHRDLMPIRAIMGNVVDRIDFLTRNKDTLMGVPTGFTMLDRLLGGMQKSDLIILAARPAMGKCVTADTLLVDPHTGERHTIAELVARRSAHLLTLDESYKLRPGEACNFIDDGVKPVYRVQTALGREVKVTLSHPFLTIAGWLPLQQLRVGDRIGVPRQLPVFGSEEPADAQVKVLAEQAANTQRMPLAAFRLSRPKLELFLRYLRENNTDLAVGPSGKAFARDLQHLLLRVGVLAQLYPVQSGNAENMVYELSLAESTARRGTRFGAVTIAAAARHPSPNLVPLQADDADNCSQDVYWDTITAIEYLGERQVYDLTVDKTHNFVADDVLVHNTSLAINVAQNAAKRYNARVAIFSLEMSNEQLAQRLLSMETGIDSHRLRLGQLHEEEWPILLEAANVLAGTNIFIDDTPAASVNEIRTKCRRLYAEHGLDMVLIDYMQLMSGQSGSSGRNENRQQEISYISRSLKALARELNVPVIALSQLSRAVEGRSDKRPMLSDLRESGCLAGDTPVYLPHQGISVPISDLAGTAGATVLSLNTESWRQEAATVTNAFCTGVKPVFRLATQLGRKIRATANHRFLTINGWKRLDELTSGEHIAVPRILPGPATAGMTYEELALLGHLIGDGCMLPRHAMQYTTREQDLAENVVGYACAVFGDRVTPRIHQERNWVQVYLSSSKRLTHRVRNPVAAWLSELGIFGLRSYEKYVPQAVFQQDNSRIAHFLRHLWATDGCIRMTWGKSPRPAIYYASSSQRLAYDVQHLLLRLGINGRVHSISQNRGRGQWHVTLSGQEDITRYASVIGATGAYRQESLRSIIAYLDGRIANTNRDIIPAAVWRKYAVPAMATASLTTREMQAGLGMQYCGTGIYKQNLGRERAARLAQVVQSPVLNRLATSDVYWDAVASIAPDGEEPVYDLTVPGNHNFVAGDIVVHNSIEQDADVVLFIYRDDYYNEESEQQNIADVIVAKHRHGSTGTVSLYFRKELTQFRDLEIQRTDLDY